MWIYGHVGGLNHDVTEGKSDAAEMRMMAERLFCVSLRTVGQSSSNIACETDR